MEVPTESGTQNIVCASAYSPDDNNDIPSQDVQGPITSSGINIHNIIGSDANVHPEVSGSSNTIRRYECLTEYLTSTEVDILNKGSKPTFINAIREEVIDLTL